MKDPISRMAEFLAGHVEWVRHKQFADEFLADVDACARVVRGLARGPAEQKYLGPCGAAVVDWGEGCETSDVGTCDGDVYAYRGARVGRCKTCGAEVATSEREAWLDGQVREHNYRDIEIARAYNVNVKTMRTWHARGQLLAHGEDRDGRPLFNVGETLDMFRALAVRRAEDEAKRARRAATKAEESEDAA